MDKNLLPPSLTTIFDKDLPNYLVNFPTNIDTCVFKSIFEYKKAFQKLQ